MSLAAVLPIRMLAVALAAGFALGQAAPPETPTETPTAAEIMTRVAENQRRSEALRAEYVYKQHIHIATHKPNVRMMREENADYDVVPLPGGIQKHLKSLTGRYWKKDKYIDITGDPPREGPKSDVDWIHNLRSHEAAPIIGSNDADLIRYLRGYLLDDKSRDGLARALFPLTYDEQKDYEFQLLGREVEEGRNVYHLAFSPRDKKEELAWTGEAFIDVAEFQPVRVFTKTSHRLPFLVRTTWFDLPGLGFNVVYQRQEDGVWFPWIFGTEFSIHAGPIFFLNRDVAISVENSEFAHPQHVETK